MTADLWPRVRKSSDTATHSAILLPKCMWQQPALLCISSMQLDHDEFAKIGMRCRALCTWCQAACRSAGLSPAPAPQLGRLSPRS